MYDRIRGTVKQYPYRTAIVSEIFLRVPRNTVDGLERQLAEVAGERPDNHTAYGVVQGENQPAVYIAFTDFTAAFGHSIREEEW